MWVLEYIYSLYDFQIGGDVDALSLSFFGYISFTCVHIRSAEWSLHESFTKQRDWA